MPISTLQTIDRKPYKKKIPNIFIYVVAVVAALVLIFFGKNIFAAIKNLKAKSALTADVLYGRAEVYVNDEDAGTTPFESDEIKPGSNKISVKSATRVYETTINFLSNNDKYIHNASIIRDLGVSELFSSGQDLWFDEDTSGTVLRVISEPSGASVFIDNTEIGKTPYTSAKLSEGDYDVRVEMVGYEPQKSRVRIQKGYTSNISMKLFPMPVPSRVSPFEGSDNLYDVSSDNEQVIADTQTWAKGVIYWNQTRGVNLEGVGMNKEPVFDYFIDYKGNVYNARAEIIPDLSNDPTAKDALRGAYLGRVSDGTGLTDTAAASLKAFKNVQIGEPKTTAKILETGLGWLRVRSDPSLNGAEIAKVDVGKEYPVLETQGDWVKIIASENVEGWVSKTYVEITDKTAQ